VHPPDKGASKPDRVALAERRVVAAIPARYAATRLPGKPLHLLAGKPMILHVLDRARGAQEVDRVVVLTDDERIAEVVRGAGGEAEMTPADCASGTDRIAWAARSWDAYGVINIQGDEPLMDSTAVDALARHLRQSDDEMATLAVAAVEEDLGNPNAVKVVLDGEGNALYFSRAPIPYPRAPGLAPTLKHLGIYGYRRDVLLRVAALAPVALERCESLEQLRALYHGIRIRVLVTTTNSWGVDTLEDAERVDRILRSGRGAGGELALQTLNPSAGGSS
jgi:3-deoxy-manno-octulosonate cytidylyltransferase (CMP-KDO synthetase)